MRDVRPNDDEIVAEVRRRIRVEGRMFWSLLFASLIICALFGGILEFHLPMQTTGMVALGVLLIWIMAAYRILRAAPARLVVARYSEDVLRRTIDDQHRRWRWLYAFVFLMVAGLAAMITGVTFYIVDHLAAHAPGRLAALLAGRPAFMPGPMAGIFVVVLEFAFFSVAAAFQVCFGPGFSTRANRRALNDEHTRALQHRAAMFGYLLCVIAMCAVLCVMTFSPLWGLFAMPGAVAAAIVLPGLYFLFLQWRAERNG